MTLENNSLFILLVKHDFAETTSLRYKNSYIAFLQRGYSPWLSIRQFEYKNLIVHFDGPYICLSRGGKVEIEYILIDEEKSSADFIIYKEVPSEIINFIVFQGAYRKQFTSKQRKLFFLRNPVCVNCGTDKRLEIDHIIPVSKGGGNEDSNLQALCKTCNLKKFDKTN